MAPGLKDRWRWKGCSMKVMLSLPRGLDIDTVHRAGIDAKVAARALNLKHGMHQFSSANDGINRAGLNALSAAYALCLSYGDDGWQRILAVFRVQWHHWSLEKFCQAFDGDITTWRAPVDGFTLSNAGCVG